MAGNRIKGITIEIGGDTTKLDKALSATNKEIKTTQTTLKDVERLLKLDPRNVELLDQKQRLLAQAAELTADKFEQLKKVAEESTVSNVQYDKWQRSFTALQRQITKTTAELTSLETERKKLADLGFAPDSAPMMEVQEKVEALGGKLEVLKQKATSTYEELGRPISIEQWDGLQREMSETAQAAKDAESALNDIGDSAEDAAGDLEDISDASNGATSAFDGVSGVVAGAALSIGSKLVDAAIAAVQWMWNLDEATEEYREDMGKLNTAFEAAGYSAETAKEAYQGFYNILGDTDTATEASQLLAQLVNNEEDIATWTEIAAGVYGTFGDALPIEGLIEAANETAKTGKVTGVLADALNWVGMSEDEFNESLAMTADAGDRARLIMNNLGVAYKDAAEAFYENNETVIESRENQAQLDETLASLGETVARLKNELFDLFGPMIIGGIELATGALNVVVFLLEGINQLVDWLGEKMKTVIDFFQELAGESKTLSFIGDTIGGALDFIGGGKSSGAHSLAAPYSLKAATADNLPYLAQGTVTRPNSPFLAVVGDNTQEPEIVAPYSTVKQAALDAMAESGNGLGPTRITVNFTGTLAQLVRMMQPEITVETNRRGPQLVK